MVHRYAGVPIATRLSFFLFFPFCLFGDAAFSEYFFCTIPDFSLYGEYIVRCFLPDGVFSTLCPRAGFFISAYYVRIQSINQNVFLVLGASVIREKIPLVSPFECPAWKPNIKTTIFKAGKTGKLYVRN